MTTLFNKIQNLGIDTSEKVSLAELKTKRLFNKLSIIGAFVSVLHFSFNVSVDLTTSLLHLSWGVLCLIGLLIHAKGHFLFARVLVCFSVMTLGGLASARVGAEYYAHIPMFGIFVAAFFFFNLNKEWIYLVLMTVMAITLTIITELNFLKAATIYFENAVAVRIGMLIFTIVFVALEIVYLVRYSALNEKAVNTELTISNKNLKDLNQQKTVLLQEIHHRVKNNLQFIISLVKLHAEEITDEQAKAIIDDFMLRLHSVSIMHQMMYTSNTIGKINFDDFVKKLVINMQKSYNTDKKVAINVQSSVDEISNQAIVPLSLIIHELIANSFEHAFTKADELNQINISFHQKNDKRYKLTYHDNGIWKDNTGKKFGSELITLLTEQLSGKLDFQTDKEGTRYSFDVEI